jgi:hypothetical protein
MPSTLKRSPFFALLTFISASVPATNTMRRGRATTTLPSASRTFASTKTPSATFFGAPVSAMVNPT